MAVAGLVAALWVLAATVQAGRTAEPLVASVSDVPARLVDTGLYLNGRIGEIDPRNQPFTPQYPLWSDGLTKRRWVYLPPGATIDAADESAWTLPVGTTFWKEFSRESRRVETRFSRRTESGWVFATYVWNADGTEAMLAPDAGLMNAADLPGGRQHEVPSRSDCVACHGTDQPTPLGFTALQLSPDRDPLAVHAEDPRPGDLTLGDLVASGQLVGARADLLSVPPRIRTSDPQTRAVLGYLSANCGHCHNGRGEIAAFGPTIRVRDLVEDGDAAARALVGQPTKWQVPGVRDGASVLVDPDSPDVSAIVVRMRSRRPSSQMPPLGTVVRDEAAVALVTGWVTRTKTLVQSH